MFNDFGRIRNEGMKGKINGLQLLTITVKAIKSI